MVNVKSWAFWLVIGVLVVIAVGFATSRHETCEYNPDISSAYEYIRYGYNGLYSPPNTVAAVVTDIPVSDKNCSKGERECRRVLEEYYGKSFGSTRNIEWLRNPETGRLLELDGYNDELKIGFEYNGRQHYEWPNYTNQTSDEFIQQRRRDIYKRKQCDVHGVYLITIPHTVTNIKTFILDNLPD
jgi:hypothetical protein